MQTTDVLHSENQLLLEIWDKLLFPEADLQEVIRLYEKYRYDLQTVRRQQQALFSIKDSVGLVPQLSDLEAEITYLRIRETMPSAVIEISPASGWSTSWILHALKDNGKGMLYSYDLVDDSTRVVPRQLAKDRWQFFQGDITGNLDLLPESAEYLFIDSDHSDTFAYWYIDAIFPRYKKGTRVSVHDILKHAHEPGWGKESIVLCAWLAEKKMNCMTASRAMKDKGYNRIMETRQKLGIYNNIQQANYNSMIFFEL